MKRNPMIVSRQDVREANSNIVVRNSNGQILVVKNNQVINAPYKVQRILSDTQFSASDIAQAGNAVLRSFINKAA